MKKILVVIPVEERHKEYLQSKYPEGQFVYNSISDVTKEQVMEADMILGNAPAAMVAENDHLEFLQLNSAGADAYLKDGILKEHTVLVNSSGAYGLAVAEHMFAMTLMLMKNLNQYYSN